MAGPTAVARTVQAGPGPGGARGPRPGGGAPSRPPWPASRSTLGASFVGPTQDAVRSSWRRTRLRHHPHLQRRGQPDPLARHGAPLPGDDPGIPGCFGLVDIGPRSGSSSASQGASASPNHGSSPQAAADAASLGGWLRSIKASAGSRDLMAIMSRVTWGPSPTRSRMLHAVRYVKTSWGLDRMPRRRRWRAAGPLPGRLAPDGAARSPPNSVTGSG